MTELAKIVVVDDDHDLRRTICDYLVSVGHDVQQAADGNNAMSLIASEEPQLVLTDILMPDKEGFSTIMDIRAAYENIKIIAMSGGGQMKRLDLLKSAHVLGADAVIAKPFEFDDLCKTIEKVLCSDG